MSKLIKVYNWNPPWKTDYTKKQNETKQKIYLSSLSTGCNFPSLVTHSFNLTYPTPSEQVR